MAIFWVLVADKSAARIFTTDAASGELVEHDDLTHPDSRLHARDLTTDLPGRQHDGNTTGHHAVEGRSNPYRQEAAEFASEIADYLQHHLAKKHFEWLIVVCEPSFLGILRHAFDEHVKKHVTLEVTKNLVKHSIAEIRGHLPKHLPTND